MGKGDLGTNGGDGAEFDHGEGSNNLERGRRRVGAVKERKKSKDKKGEGRRKRKKSREERRRSSGTSARFFFLSRSRMTMRKRPTAMMRVAVLPFFLFFSSAYSQKE